MEHRQPVEAVQERGRSLVVGVLEVAGQGSPAEVVLEKVGQDNLVEAVQDSLVVQECTVLFCMHDIVIV